MAFLLLLVPSTLYAAGSSGNRNFVVDKPFSEVMEALQKPEDLKKLLNRPDIEVLSLTLEEVTLDGETILGDKNLDLKYKAKIKIAGHIKIHTKEVGTLELWIEGYVQRSNNSATLHVYTTKTCGQLTYFNAWVVFSKQTEKTTLVQMHATIRVSIPCFRLRLIRRIANRVASNIVCCLIQDGLCQAERQIQSAVK